MSAVEILFGTPNLDAIKRDVLGLVPIFDRVAKAGQQQMAASAKAQVASEKSAVQQITQSRTQAAKDQARIASDAAKAELNFVKAGQRAIADAERERTRTAEAESRNRIRQAEQEAHQIEATVRRRSRGFGSMMGGATGRVMGMAGRVAGVAAALGGGFAIGDALSAGIQNEKTAGTLVRNSAITGGLTKTDVEGAARQSSIATGTTIGENLEGVDAFIKESGNLQGAVEMVKDLARYSTASGAAMGQLGTIAGQTFTHMGGDIGKTKEVLLALSGQAKAGAIDIRDLAQYGGRLVGNAELFQGNVGSNIETLGALTQIAKRKGGKIDAAEATESAARIFGEVSMHKDAFEELGVKVKGTGGKLRPVEDILLDTLVKTKGDITAIPKLFGRQAGGVETGLAQSFLEGSGGKTDAASLAAGRSAAAAEIQGLRRPNTEQDIDAGVKDALTETNRKLAIATTQFQIAMSDKLLPKLTELIPKFVELIPAMQRVVDFFTGGSLTEGVLKALGVALGAEVLGASVQSGVSAIFTKIASSFLKMVTPSVSIAAGVVNVGSGGNVPVPPGTVPDVGKGLIGGSLTAGIGIAGAAGAVLASGYAFSDYTGKSSAANVTATDIINAGTAGTPEEKRARLAAAQGMVSEIKTHKDTFGGAVDDMGRPLGESAQVAGTSDKLKALEAVVSKLSTSLEGVGAAADQATASLTNVQKSAPKEPNDVPGGGWGNGGN